MLDTSARYYMKIQDELGENKEMDKTEKFYSLYEVLKLNVVEMGLYMKMMRM